MRAAIIEIGSQVRRSFMAAGREEGVPVTQGWHSLLPAHLAGQAQPSGASLRAGTSHGKGSGQGARRGCSAQGTAGGAPRPPLAGFSSEFPPGTTARCHLLLKEQNS